MVLDLVSGTALDQVSVLELEQELGMPLDWASGTALDQGSGKVLG
jgi:hypothetical protein